MTCIQNYQRCTGLNQKVTKGDLIVEGFCVCMYLFFPDLAALAQEWMVEEEYEFIIELLFFIRLELVTKSVC